MTLPSISPLQIIEALGYLGIFCIVLAESGIFVGFFLPGDSLLLTAGLLATQGVLNLWVLLIIIPIAAILGDSIGYSFGRYIGPRLFTRQDSFFFNKKHIDRARDFYERHGSRAILLSRFIPIVRTFVPIIAGVGHMKYRTFLLFNALGGVLWSVVFVLLGYFLGRAVPDLEHYIIPLVAAVVIISFLPVVFEWWRAKQKSS